MGCFINSEAEFKSLTKTTQNGESKDSLSKHVELSVLWEYTVTKALGRHLESGRIYGKAFDKAKTSGEERPETLLVSVGLGDCSLE